jgi:magnesium chelatase subunit ChlD-like protein
LRSALGGRRWQGKQRAAQRGGEYGARIHWPRTLLAKRGGPLRREHLRFQPRIAQAGTLHCFLLDGSGSMLAGGRLGQTAGLLQQLLQQVYQQRGQVAIISFAGARAMTLVYPTSARPITSRAVQDWLRAIDTGGGTPFAHGIGTAETLLRQAAQREPAQQRWLWLLTDGRTRERPDAPVHADVRIVVDCERQRGALGRCVGLAEDWGAEYFRLEDLIEA